MASGRTTGGEKTGSRIHASLAQEAARLGFAEELVASLLRSGFIQPQRGADGAFRFSFQDLVLLRSAQALTADRVPVAKLRKALRKLQSELPEGKPLSGLTLTAEGKAIVVRDGGAKWVADSGQGVLDFAEKAPVAKVESVKQATVHHVAFGARKQQQKAPTDIASLFEQACAMEEAQPDLAMDRYRAVLHQAPDHADAHVNLGRLLQMRGQSAEAERHYRTALALSPKDATAAFNLGTALEDQSRWEDAIVAYAQAVAIDPHCADAHYNLACLYEKTGRKAQAIRHLISARAARPQ